eukprot:CAMPEP_0170438542 /NCGR_PEP_ID=MMETSP0117_2-20130122/45291_1 /TAXON_ID=400756 /ORGANISM="Durinskia baltica, Strain CSIRO CS-38" /LENGTH=78 /DNA_ID=CAMNT_0010698773 /DNA_START=156 /DNA_END=390 /DNA_ORIENTATION=-
MSHDDVKGGGDWNPSASAMLPPPPAASLRLKLLDLGATACPHPPVAMGDNAPDLAALIGGSRSGVSARMEANHEYLIA